MEEISCSDTEAPTEFNTKSISQSLSGLSVAVERCPLCSEARRPFYCKGCVNEGQFHHSTARYPDSYLDKQRIWEQKKTLRGHLLEGFKEKSAPVQRKIVTKTQIDECRRNIELLKTSLQASKQLALKGKSAQERIRRENLIRYAKGKKHQEKKRRIIDYIVKVTDAIAKKREKLTERQGEVMELRKSRIADLTTYIFPVTAVKMERSTGAMGESDDVLKEALQEASQMAYVRGRWITASSSSQYKIVAPVLPSNGDYSQYNIMVAKAAEEGSREDTSHTSPGNTIIAGLCHTSQLLTLLAYFLSVSLYKKQCFSEFCLDEVPERQFNRSVSRLNKNVLYLCFSQGVSAERLEPKHTPHNLVELLNHSQLGRIGWFDVEQDMMDSVEDSNGQSDESDDDFNNCAKGELDSGDWETVPDNIPLPSAATQPESLQALGYVSQDMTESALTASSVLSSAFSTFGSYFRR
ncbi:beclin 1-associated autophagy-related key regulator-like isoform X2 [Mya arenaria]|uniref:beclin 1-associated autophagy-related key regulator-like isoform X1 n=1 Tax=Mya arenaria TaxID=6604 RepID=UPI0022E76B19|nr:beclin 1-associated autophagy-related key regulator-like isoform X1 [Mya arenaria]XP_052775984.1 beclin 1-associated autophagy-related key regulator-like isoform X2 [Mya arenaria]